MVVGLYLIIVREEYVALDGKKVTFIHTLSQMKFALKYPTQSKKTWAYSNEKSMENNLLKEQIILLFTFSNNKHSVLYRELCLNYIKIDYLGIRYQTNREASTLLATNNG